MHNNKIFLNMLIFTGWHCLFFTVVGIAIKFPLRREDGWCCSIYEQLNVMRFAIDVTSFYTAHRKGEGSLWRSPMLEKRPPFTTVERERHLLPFRFLAENSLAGGRSFDGMGQRWVSSQHIHKHTRSRTHKKSDGRIEEEPTRTPKIVCTIKGKKKKE